MQVNEGTTDRLVRAVACGIALTGIKACPATSGKIGSVLIAAVFGYTAFSGNSPVYQVTGFSTAR